MSPPSAPAKPSLWRSIRAVAWSFMGVRKDSEFEQVLARVSPFHVIGVGIAGVIVLVLGLVVLVNWVVAT